MFRSCAKLAYEDAQSVIENQGLPKTASVKLFSVSEVEQDIKYLYAISKQMRERRFSNGALSINSIRLSFKLNDLGEPCGVSIYEQKDANRLIEEFMLRANMSVAEKIAKHYPNEALLRQHSPPHERTLVSLSSVHYSTRVLKVVLERIHQDCREFRVLVRRLYRRLHAKIF